MVRQAFDLIWGLPSGRKVLRPRSRFGQAVRSETFEGFHNANVEYAPSLLEQAVVGDLMGEGVLEGIGMVGEEPRLVQELGGLEVRQGAVDRRLGQLSNGLQQGQGHLVANDRR